MKRTLYTRPDGSPAPTVALTFDLVTDESASDGDYAESGWIGLGLEGDGARLYMTEDGTATGAPLYGDAAQAWFTAHETDLVTPFEESPSRVIFACTRSDDLAESVLAYLYDLALVHGVGFVEWSDNVGASTAEWAIFRGDGMSDETDDGTPAELSIDVHFDGFTDDEWRVVRGVLRRNGL